MIYYYKNIISVIIGLYNIHYRKTSRGFFLIVKRFFVSKRNSRRMITHSLRFARTKLNNVFQSQGRPRWRHDSPLKNG